jgi:hypothetical protein
MYRSEITKRIDNLFEDAKSIREAMVEADEEQLLLLNTRHNAALREARVLLKYLLMQ